MTTVGDAKARGTEELAAREHLLDAIIAAEPECVKLIDAQGALLMMNPAGLRMLEADSFEQARRAPLRELVAEEDRAAFDDLAARVLRGESGVLEFRLTGLKGTARWIETHAAPLRDDEGRVTALLGISRDVTERRLALEALRRQETNFRNLFEQATEGIFVCDAQLRFTAVNPAGCQMVGYAREDLLKLAISDLVDPADLTRLSVAIERLSSGASLTSEWRVQRKSGRLLVAEVCAKRLSDGSIQAFARDVTDRAELQAQLMQSQKMESLGRLAGGIAHDFNNLLTVITGTAELALLTSSPDNPLRGEIEQIRLAAERGSTLTGQLLAMSRQQILQPEIFDLNAVLRGMEGMLRRLIGEDIRLELALADGPLQVRADPSQFEQVILNLILNARDAILDGGTVTIETRLADPHVLLAIRDTGIGMDEATRKRIFEPFFTTKALGKGTGLGLSMVYGTVEQSGGTVTAESEPGAGTVIRISLPWMSGGADEGVSDDQDTSIPDGSETILLVEDEPVIRELTRRFLEGAGYVVVEAGNGADALERLASHTGPIDLLLTDVVMPGMNGRELALRVMKARPDVKVLYTSGYTDDVILRRGVLSDLRRFIPKPYTLRQLRSKVRDVLDS